MKECGKCKQVKSFSEFAKSSSRKDGLQLQCKVCKKKQYQQSKSSKPKSNKIYNYHTSIKCVKKINDKWGKGVYGIFANGECLYIGESIKLYKRFIEHKTLYKNPKSSRWQTNLYNFLQDYPNWVIGIIEQTENHKEQEKYYTNKFQPLYV